MDNLEAPSHAELQDALLKARARMRELTLANEQLNGQKEHLISNARNESQQLKNERNIHVQAAPQDDDSEWAFIIRKLHNISKQLPEEHNLAAFEAGEKAHIILNYKFDQIENLIEYMEEESTPETNTPPSTNPGGTPPVGRSIGQDGEEAFSLRALLENSEPLEMRERTLIHDYEDKINAQDMTLRARQATINTQARRITELVHKSQQMKNGVLAALKIINETG